MRSHVGSYFRKCLTRERSDRSIHDGTALPMAQVSLPGVACKMHRLVAVLVLTASSSPLCAADVSKCAACEPAAALSIEAAYTGEAWRQASGGLRTGGGYLDNLDLRATGDGGRLFGIDGLTLFGDVLYNNGQGLSDELVGATQGVSNIETVRAVRLYELWGEWQLGNQQSLRAGLYDLNSEFDSIEAAGLVHPSLAWHRPRFRPKGTAEARRQRSTRTGAGRG